MHVCLYVFSKRCSRQKLQIFLNYHPHWDQLFTGWGLLNQFPPFCYFPNFSTLWKHTLDIEHHMNIWQVSPQLSCGDTCQISMWFKEFNRYFCRIEYFTYGVISEQSFSNPHPSPPFRQGVDMRCDMHVQTDNGTEHASKESPVWLGFSRVTPQQNGYDFADDILICIFINTFELWSNFKWSLFVRVKLSCY